MPAWKSFFLLARGVTLKSVKLLRDIPDESMILHPASRVRSVIHGWFLFYTPKDVREGLGAPTTSGGAIIIRCGKTGGESVILHPEGRNQAVRAIPRRACGSVKAELLIKNTR